MNDWRTFRIALLWLAALSFAAPMIAEEAAAQPPRGEEAEALFVEGRQALGRKDFTTACAMFRESYGLDPAAGTAMNWATCEERRGHVASAWRHWDDAISLLPPGDDRIAYARRQMHRLDDRIPYLSVRLAPGVPLQTVVLRDELTLGNGSLGLTLPVDPGPHEISVRAPGHADRAFRIQLREREQKELVVEPGAKLPPATIPNDTVVTRGPPTTQRTIGWMACGVGVAGFATVAVTSLMLPAKEQAVTENCVDRVCNQKGIDAAKAGTTLQTLNSVGWVAGIVAGGLGAFLVISSPSSGTSRPRTEIGVSSQGGAVTVRYRGTF